MRREAPGRRGSPDGGCGLGRLAVVRSGLPRKVRTENTTVTPIPGDLCYFTFDGNDLATPSHGYGSDSGPGELSHIIDLALFYGRNNLLLNGDQGWVPGNVFASVVEGLDEMAAACQDVWMGGARGETLTFARVESN